MCKSMTGYGRAEFVIETKPVVEVVEGLEEKSVFRDSFTVEVRSLNHRYLDVTLRCPERFLPLESKIREEIKRRISRGSCSVFIRPSRFEEDNLTLNVPLIRTYLEAEKELRERFGLEGRLDLNFILRLKDIFSTSSASRPDLDNDWRSLGEGLGRALDGLEEMRLIEGAALKEDLFKRLEVIEGSLDTIEARIPEVVSEYRQRLTREFKEFIGEGMDESRIIAEAAVFADKTNIAEEVVRFTSHISQMRRYLELEEPVGRRLDFLCQELLREINTMASKSPDLQITQTSIELKGELEKIREQVQNIE